MGSIESAIPPEKVRNFINPIMKFILSSPLHGMTSGFMMLLDFKGRKSGRQIVVPVSYHVLDGQPTVFSGGKWVANLTGDAEFSVVMKGSRRTARAEIVDDPKAVAQAITRVLNEVGANNAQRFGFKVTGEVPTSDQVQAALEGRKMLRLRLS